VGQVDHPPSEADDLRAAVLRLWDEFDGWIPGAGYKHLADVLGVPAERLKSYRDGGLSRPSWK
jgi:NADH:ubiquinone oxidoreductase subunit E